VIELFELVVQIPDPPAARDGFVQDAASGHLFDVLPEVPDRQLAGNRHVPFIGGLLADDHPEQRRLAGPVRADETDLLARIQLERGIDEEELAAVLLTDVRKGNHGFFAVRNPRFTDCSSPQSAPTRRH
jgi:hypothetical protein